MKSCICSKMHTGYTGEKRVVACTQAANAGIPEQSSTALYLKMRGAKTVKRAKQRGSGAIDRKERRERTVARGAPGHSRNKSPD